MYLPNIAALRALLFIPTPIEEFIVAGYFASGDGGGGLFTWVDDTNPPSDDKGIIICAPGITTSGYFKRIFSGPINVKWFGAIKGGVDPNPPAGYPNTIFDVTPYVHRARDSKEFADNGTLYFPKGEYPGAFEFTYLQGMRNEISIIGDGQGSVLKSNGEGYPNTQPDAPILLLGYRNPPWAWAKVFNIKIDDEFGTNPITRHSIGVKFDNPSGPFGAEVSGRWVFERVVFTNCPFGVT